MKLSHPRLSWLDSGHPYSEDYADIYFSADDPMAESQHVFLNGTHLRERLKVHKEKVFTVGEIGFGSGLNFLQTWKLWRELNSNNTTLHYIAFEKHLLHKDDLQHIFKLWPDLSESSERLLAQFPVASSGCHRLILENGLILDLHFGEALDRLSKLDKRSGINSWFLDGFAPKNNVDLWQPALLTEIARLSNIGTTLASYSVAGDFRRGLESLGFMTEKLEGFGSKRHMLSAVFKTPIPTHKNPENDSQQAWNRLPGSELQNNNPSIAIIGAGLAGCSLAYSLSLRGLKSTLIESGSTIAAGASAIPQFALRPRLFQTHSALAEFYLQSYLFSIRQLNELSQRLELQWHSCGVLQLQEALNKKSALNFDRIEELYSSSIVECIEAAPVHPLLDRRIDSALYFPDGGWINPEHLCTICLEASGAKVRVNTEIVTLKRRDEKWIVQEKNGEDNQFDYVLLANSDGISNFEQTQNLPLEISAGQVSVFASAGSIMNIDKVICGDRSLFPAAETNPGGHLIAASYRRNSDLQLLKQDDEQNVNAVQELLNEEHQLSKELLSSQVALRTNTVDKSPLVGQLPNLPVIRERYAELSSNAKMTFDPDNTYGNYFPGLYISAAHGSNGLATSLLSAEIVASLLCNEQLPVTAEILDELNPVRFAIRDLKRQID
ncbi:MAG: bifunctional tRNA (5-methylaminomethyl-2-thiouridine)(34)-methyltransferase MnmD/FAD-dependent 5-carboxymethylaminomethyl-2-thiouridine(34) oxidoreductase MnmC [Pseudomonadales bacterium]|nr:bifunctional tRNA (5-methylaminomethyl-2-thiouridine)(34)-methyltransferase MnmD/FAD-dependent 5-carboxymethylaminomethyl-2-thiouridine(34) oxidoreductase MnmC [Pseudomonadales bacterium]